MHSVNYGLILLAASYASALGAGQMVTQIPPTPGLNDADEDGVEWVKGFSLSMGGMQDCLEC